MMLTVPPSSFGSASLPRRNALDCARSISRTRIAPSTGSTCKRRTSSYSERSRLAFPRLHERSKLREPVLPVGGDRDLRIDDGSPHLARLRDHLGDIVVGSFAGRLALPEVPDVLGADSITPDDRPLATPPDNACHGQGVAFLRLGVLVSKSTSSWMNRAASSEIGRSLRSQRATVVTVTPRRVASFA